mgnify:CR=1 FL=1
MKKTVFVAIAIICLLLAACEMPKESTQKNFVGGKTIGNYERAVYHMYGDRVGGADFVGKYLYLDGTVKSIAKKGEEFYAVVDAGNGRRWIVPLGMEPDCKMELCTAFVGKKVRIFGEYAAFAVQENMPVLALHHAVDSQTGEVFGTRWFIEGDGALSLPADGRRQIESPAAYVPPSPEPSSPVRTPTVGDVPDENITEEAYEQITTNMHYEEIVELLGSDGALLKETVNSEGEMTRLYQWRAVYGANSVANVLFRDGKVYAKAKTGF